MVRKLFVDDDVGSRGIVKQKPGEVVGCLRYDAMEPLPVARPVDRIDYVRSSCVGKRVLDLGAYDETEISKPQHHSWRWLHREIASVASQIVGVDSAEVVRRSGQIDTAFGSKIVFGEVDDLTSVVADLRPEVVVAGELIEHTRDTVGWLSALGHLAPGARLVATTPNATSLINGMLALVARENCHPDHIQVYSFKTLATLARRIGLEGLRILPYYYDPHLFRAKVPRGFAGAVTVVDRVFLRPFQFVFPLTAFGLVLDGRFGPQSDDRVE